MEQANLSVETRQGIGKSVTRKLRAVGKLPGVLYGLGGSQPIVVDPRTIHKILMDEKLRNRVWAVKGTGLEGKNVMVKDYQIDPVSRVLLHVDLLEIDIKKKIQVTVPLSLTGKAVGVADGGVLNILTRELDVKCLPTAVPSHIDVDVTELKIGQSIHLGDLKLPEGVEAMSQTNPTLVACVPPTKEEEAVAALAPTAEPEVITAKAKEGDEAAPAAGAAPAADAKKDEKKK